MTLTPHPYRGEQDLAALQDLLRAIIRVDPSLSHVHPGDLEWWFYYNPIYPPPEETTLLWHTPGGDLAAWTLIDWRTRLFDLFVHPDHRSEALFDMFLNYFEVNFRQNPSDETVITCDWCHRTDTLYEAALVRAGYTVDPYLTLFEQNLDKPLSAPPLPTGFRFLTALDDNHISSRASAHYSAFSREGHPSKMTPQAYRHLMTAPSYQPEFDICIVNEREDVVAFAMAWIDPLTGHGEFEPVGVHKDYQRRGLGRQVLLEGMRRMHAHGLTKANVATWINDSGNVAFYLAAGFEVIGSNDHYTKPI